MSDNLGNHEDPLDEMAKNPTPISALERPEVRGQLERADVVFGVDAESQERVILFGVERLKSIVKTRSKQRCTLMVFKHGPNKSDLDYLCGMIQKVKGSCDYAPHSAPAAISQQTVRVYAFDQKTVQTIPVAKLAPGYVLASVPGVDGLVYVKEPTAALLNLKPRHKDLSEECKRVLQFYIKITSDVDRRTFDEQLRILLTDGNPVRELKVLFQIASAYHHFAKTKIIARESRKRLFDLLLRSSLAEKHTVLEVVAAETKALRLAKEIVDYYFDHDFKTEFLDLFEPEEMFPIS